MAQEYPLERIRDLECRALRAVCGSTDFLGREARDTAMGDLADYNWRVAEHRIVYAALVRIQQMSGASAAEQLPAQATRMGFPDVDWELYLRRSERVEPDLRTLILELKAANEALL